MSNKMQWFIFFIILSLNVGNVHAGSDGDEEGKMTPRCSTPTIPSPETLLTFDIYLGKVRQAAQKQDAYLMHKLSEELFDLSISEEQWEAIAHSSHIPKWPHQTVWRSAVGADLFLNAALDIPHQNLLRNGLRPLLLWANGAALFEEALEQAVTNVHAIIRIHPYIRRRTALFALANAARLLDPFAGFFLNEALFCFYEDHKKKFTERDYLSDKEISFRHDMVKFFNKTHARIQQGFKGDPERVRSYIDQPGIEDFIDLSGEDLKDKTKLEEKAALGLPHYHKLLGDLYNGPDKPIQGCDDATIASAIQHYTLAGEYGDFEGYDNASYLISGVLSCHRLFPEDPEERRRQYENSHQYEFLAGWYGSEHAACYAGTAREMDERGIERTSKKILEVFRQVLKQRPTIK